MKHGFKNLKYEVDISRLYNSPPEVVFEMSDSEER